MNSTAGGQGSPPSSGPSPQRTYANQQNMRFFAAGLCGLLVIFVVAHWARKLCVRPSWVALTRPCARVIRYIRSVLVRKAPAFPSWGHALLVAAFASLNVAVAVTNVTPSLGNYASRFGWLAVSNMCLLVFLGLKNTPLAFLTAYSYERINFLHQVAGYCMFLWMVLHACLYTSTFALSHRLQSVFAEPQDYFGIVAGFAFLAVVFAAVVLRRLWYELFYVVHIVGWVVGLVATGIHQPSLGKTVIFATVLSATMWFLDRLTRGTRILWYCVNNKATLHPISDGGTRVVMAKTPLLAKPGKHCFIWIPSIRRFETHPFTITSTKPNLEFVVRARNGFTRDLHEFARARPGASVRASVDGPYGTLPDPIDFDKVLLVAGGSGATFTFAIAGNILERMDATSTNHIIFIWAVQKHENLLWFADHLNNLRTHTHSHKVSVDLYVSRVPPAHIHTPQVLHTVPSALLSTPSSGESQSSVLDFHPAPSFRSGEGDEEKMIDASTGKNHTGSSTNGGDALSLHGTRHPVKYKRPDVESLIRSSVQATPKSQRILIAACGPTGLMRVTRDTAAKLMRGNGPAVEVHCEEFGW